MIEKKETIRFIPHGNVKHLEKILEHIRLKWMDQIDQYLKETAEEMFTEMLKKQPIYFKRNCRKNCR